MGALASDQDLAPRLFFKSLLVQTSRTNEESYVVDARLPREVNLLLNLGGVLQGIKNGGIQVLNQGGV